MTRPFANTITGANGALIRQRIKSPNYVTGVSGWTINQDGSAEFSNAVLRGSLIVGVLATGAVVIEPSLPPEIVTFYSSNYGSTVNQVSILQYVDANNYKYSVTMTGGIIGAPLEASGWVIAGTVYEISITYFDGIQIVQSWGQFTPMQAQFNNAQLGVGDGGTYWDFDINGTSAPRGLIVSGAQTFNGTASTTTSTTEQLLWTMINAAIFPNGRAFLVFFIASIKSATVQNPNCNIRETNLAGTLLFGGRETITATGQDLPLRKFSVIVNTSGADLTKKLCFTATPAVATAVTVDAGTGSSWWLVFDIGPASSYPSAPSLT